MIEVIFLAGAESDVQDLYEEQAPIEGVLVDWCVEHVPKGERGDVGLAEDHEVSPNGLGLGHAALHLFDGGFTVQENRRGLHCGGAKAAIDIIPHIRSLRAEGLLKDAVCEKLCFGQFSCGKGAFGLVVGVDVVFHFTIAMFTGCSVYT